MYEKAMSPYIIITDAVTNSEVIVKYFKEKILLVEKVMHSKERTKW